MATDGRPAGPPTISRRQFVAGTVALAGAAALGLAGCGSVATGSPPGAARSWIPVSTAGLRPGEPQWVEFDVPQGSADGTPAAPTGTPGASLPSIRGGAWVVLEADGSAVAFDPSCPHQRCLYDWDGASAQFACRCHRGYFAVDGTVISGPPPRPLSRYEVRQAGAGTIEIAWAGRS